MPESNVSSNLDKLQNEFDLFMVDARKITNKSAARRARTAITPIVVRMKKFRKNSLK